MYNSLYTQLLRKSRKLHYDNILKSYSNDCKKTWLAINDLLGRKKAFNDIPDSFENMGKILSGLTEIAEGFNDFFANIGPNLAKEIPNPKTGYLNYLSDPCQENFIFANVSPRTIEAALQKKKPIKPSWAPTLSHIGKAETAFAFMPLPINQSPQSNP